MKNWIFYITYNNNREEQQNSQRQTETQIGYYNVQSQFFESVATHFNISIVFWIWYCRAANEASAYNNRTNIQQQKMGEQLE